MDINLQQLNDFEGFFQFKHNWAFKQFVNLKHKIMLLIYGNQAGKTGGAAYQYVLRILGLHPVPSKNVVYFECKNGHEYGPANFDPTLPCKECGCKVRQHKRGSRVFRFCSVTLPGQSSSLEVDGSVSEVKNTQYPEFRKWLPKSLIKKDITVRNPAIIVKDPYGGKDIIIEFISYNQSTASTAGVQRMSIWLDESPDISFYEEQLPRLLAENGDLIITYTPVDRSSWLFDELYDKASIIYRSKYICDYLSTPKLKVNPIEKQGSPYDIAVVMAATDDNPTLDTALIDALFRHIDDPDVVAIRRYGIFKQLSGRIFKDFEYATHAIPEDSLADGIPKDWTHAQGIDFHPQTPWAVAFMSMSPTNEVFVWGEWNPSPEKYTTKEISRHVATLGKGYKFRLSLIDPFAQATKKDNVTVLDDINEEFLQCKKEEICTTSFWQPWDTKGERGRDAIRERLKNSLEVKKPFNNKVVRNGRTVYLPTIWVMNNCKNVLKSMKNWRWEEWGNIGANANKDAKNKPEQKWSHFNMVLEAVFKEPAFKPSMTLHTSNQVADYYKIR